MQYLASLFTADPKQPPHFPHIHTPRYQEKTLPEAAPLVTAHSSAEGGTSRATSQKSSSETAKSVLKQLLSQASNPFQQLLLAAKHLNLAASSPTIRQRPFEALLLFGM